MKTMTVQLALVALLTVTSLAFAQERGDERRGPGGFGGGFGGGNRGAVSAAHELAEKAEEFAKTAWTTAELQGVAREARNIAELAGRLERELQRGRPVTENDGDFDRLSQTFRDAHQMFRREQGRQASATMRLAWYRMFFAYYRLDLAMDNEHANNEGEGWNGRRPGNGGGRPGGGNDSGNDRPGRPGNGNGNDDAGGNRPGRPGRGPGRP